MHNARRVLLRVKEATMQQKDNMPKKQEQEQPKKTKKEQRLKITRHNEMI
jgi:hypothetical protein